MGRKMETGDIKIADIPELMTSPRPISKETDVLAIGNRKLFVTCTGKTGSATASRPS
eukprot:CAMPEP_0177771808 /NCGR_PEP_ID=MMETSP0491_2-20121128/11836_1 /TAXON_ID=63592 /ORGANISM="Tetraselmis chuii, Strain PLY429" /LENGTH=56 /DNA_ID=CAMNT_0019289475 /DNA_START=94 /DNA_END=260 /DNA_ORIENTATION=+